MIDGDAKVSRWRANLLFAAYGAVLLFLLIRVGHLQVARHDALAELSDQNRLRPLVLQPIRGRIYDRFNRLIVDNRPSWTVTLSPQVFSEDEPLVEEVARILDMPASEISERLRQRKGHLYTPVPIKRDVSFDMVARLSELRPDLPGVSIHMEARRRYPYGKAGSHVLGYLREIDNDELAERQRKREDYLFGDLLGKEGVERTYEEILRGSKGIEYVEVDARGRITGPSMDRNPLDPVHGSNLITTLDIELQQVAEAAFSDTMRGAVVAMDPRNGALLVLASMPCFDPRNFSGVLDAATWDSLNSDDRKPLINRAIAGLYPPASTIKPVTALAALYSGMITRETRLDPCVPGGWRLGVRWFHCWKEGHGNLNLVEALEQSCDVYFYQVGVDLGLRLLNRMAVDFGFGQLTEIPIPGEVAGSFPDADYYDRTIGVGKWVEAGQVINLAIGQGEILATPLQVARFTAAIANGGNLVNPFLAQYKVVPESNEEELLTHAETRSIERLTPEYLELVHEGMVGVVNGEDGTARHVALRVPGITVAGKTGTGQNPHGENHAWFTCYAPAEDPEIVVTVLVENGGGGSAVAAPIAVTVLRSYFHDRLSTIPPDSSAVGGVR